MDSERRGARGAKGKLYTACVKEESELIRIGNGTMMQYFE
jgi:hypothetical protein